MAKQYDQAYVIGRFEPTHNGHMTLFKKAAQLADHLVVIIGSAFRAPDFKNPWCEKTRELLIRTALANDPETSSLKKITFLPIQDSIYDNQEWLTNTYEACAPIKDADTKAVLVAHEKDDTADYLNLFPWDRVNVENSEGIDATTIRSLYFSETKGSDLVIQSKVPQAVFEFMVAYRQTDGYKNVRDWFRFNEDYMLPYKNLKHPPNFYTADSVVVCAGHVLLVQRRSHPGKGLWALPGGHVKPHQTAYQAALAELEEETKIDAPVRALQGAFKSANVFDEPGRSLRKRTVTIGHYFELPMPPTGKLPKVKGASDAKKAKWVTLAEVKTKEFSKTVFEDHLDIIKYFT